VDFVLFNQYRSYKLGILISIIGFLISIATPSYSIAAQTWTTGVSMPTARTEVAGGVLDGKIYIVGGFDESDKRTNLVEAYDPKAERWSRASSLAEPLDHTVVASQDGKLYVVGGYTGVARTPSAKLLVYDPSTDKWQELKSMPTPRGALTAGFIDGILYAVGGESSGKTLNTNEAYDPKTDKWTERQPMLTNRHHLTSSVNDGKLYAIGGRNTEKSPSVNIDKNEVYDPRLDKWTSLESMPTKRSGLSATSVDHEIYVFGGEYPFDNEPKRTFNNTEIYHVKTDSWISGPALPTARHGLAAVTINGTIYVIGGGPEAGLSYSHANEIFHTR